MALRKFSAPDLQAVSPGLGSVPQINPGSISANLKNVHKASGPASQAVNMSYTLTVNVANSPVVAPFVSVPSGSTVRIRTASANAGTMYFAESRDKLETGNGTAVDADVEVIFPLVGLQLFFMGDSVGDKANYSVRSS